MNANLQKAIDVLHITDVYVRGSRAQCIDGFEPKYEQDIEKLTIQTKHGVKQSQVVQLDESQFLLRVFIEFGVRWVDDSNGETAQTTRALIEAEFVAEYAMDENLDQACIDEFSLRNAIYHVWPYWRELLMNQCGRMHLPRLVLPTMQLAHHRHQENSTVNESSE